MGFVSLEILGHFYPVIYLLSTAESDRPNQWMLINQELIYVLFVWLERTIIRTEIFVNKWFYFSFDR